MLQTMGCVSPPSGAEYKHYPEAIRNLTHQSRDLCFWPVQIAPDNEQTEVLRRKMFDGLEFGPNATWRNLPKTKQVFSAAKKDNVDMIKDVSEEENTVNLNAYGTCHYWTPLHVACFYGSQKVAKYLLSKKVIFNSQDRDGKTPLTLAEENGHVNLAKMLVAHAANESVLPDAVTEIRNLPGDKDPKKVLTNHSKALLTNHIAESRGCYKLQECWQQCFQKQQLQVRLQTVQSWN